MTQTIELNQADRKERFAFIAVLLAAMLAPLNSTMIAVALPHVIEVYSITVVEASWLVTAYLIIMASLQPVAGKLGDRWGRRRLILFGLIYFGLASLGAALSSSFTGLLFCRIHQAIAGAITLPNGQALLREMTPENRRAKRFGMIGAAIALAAAIGPPLGGALIETGGWRAIFYVNLVVIFPAYLLGWRAIPTYQMQKNSKPFDLFGAVLLSVFLISIVGLLTQSQMLIGREQWMTISALFVFAVLTLFFWHESRHPDPVMQFSLFSRRNFTTATLAIALGNLTLYSAILIIPIFLTSRQGWTDIQVGLVMMSMAGGVVLFAPIGGRLADRIGRRWPTIFGLGLYMLGVATMGLAAAFSTESVPTPLLLAGTLLGGAGWGLSTAGLRTSVVEAVASHEAGMAAGMMSTSRYLGSIIGTSVMVYLLSIPGRETNFTLVFMMMSSSALLAFLTSFWLQDWPAQERESETVEYPNVEARIEANAA